MKKRIRNKIHANKKKRFQHLLSLLLFPLRYSNAKEYSNELQKIKHTHNYNNNAETKMNESNEDKKKNCLNVAYFVQYKERVADLYMSNTNYAAQVIRYLHLFYIVWFSIINLFICAPALSLIVMEIVNFFFLLRFSLIKYKKKKKKKERKKKSFTVIDVTHSLQYWLVTLVQACQ